MLDGNNSSNDDVYNPAHLYRQAGIDPSKPWYVVNDEEIEDLESTSMGVGIALTIIITTLIPLYDAFIGDGGVVLAWYGSVALLAGLYALYQMYKNKVRNDQIRTMRKITLVQGITND